MPTSTVSLVITALSGGLLYIVYRFKDVGKRESGFAPGPPTSPIIGNLLQLPQGFLHLKFTERAREYGDIVSVKLGSDTATILSSATAVREVLELRGATTSSRPALYLANLVTSGKNIVFAPYGNWWRASRRAIQEMLSPQACRTHLPIQQAEATQLMSDLLINPEDFFRHIQRYSTSVIISVLYGQRTPRPESPAAATFWEYFHRFNDLMMPGRHPPLDLIPALQWIPERLAPWKQQARLIRNGQRGLYFTLLSEVERRMATGTSNGCCMETVIARADEFGLEREDIGYVGGVLIEAGSETTASFLKTFVLAMTASPEAQKKAQEEIDALIGDNRAPCLDDAEQLPYCKAIIQEIHRWRPSLPIAGFRASTAEETYRGYRIPKGATIFQNSWGVFHDPEMYDRPEDFMPERFLKNEFGLRESMSALGKEWRNTYAFGAGRRICPGIHLANNSLRINVVNLLWAFNFLKPLDDETGETVEPDLWGFIPDMAMSPRPFRCRIIPRSDRHADIIREEFLKTIHAFGPFEEDLSPEDKAFVDGQRAEIRLSSVIRKGV